MQDCDVRITSIGTVQVTEKNSGAARAGEQIGQRYNITYFQGVLAAKLGLLFTPVKHYSKLHFFQQFQ